MNELRVRARDAFDLRAHIAIVFRIQPNQQMIRNVYALQINPLHGSYHLQDIP